MRHGAGDDRLAASRENGHSGRDRQIARGNFVAKLVEGCRLGPDPLDAGLDARPGEIGVLGEEAVTGMDGVHPFFNRQGHDRGDVQIALDRLAGLADLIRFVGLEPVHGEAVFMRVNRDRSNAKLMSRPKDPNRDLAAVGHQQLLNPRHRSSHCWP